MPIFYVGQTDYITQLNILASTALLPIVTDNSGKFLTTDGFITSWESLPAPYSLPTASTTTLGGVKIDGTTITISNGIISGFNGSFANLTNKPTTLAGYGITDSLTATSINTAIGVETTRATAAEALKAPIASPTFTGIPLSTTATSGTNTTQIATTAFVQTAVSNLVASAPAALDTLNELATALGNDANFATSVSTAIGLKAPIASPTFTGTATIPTLNLTNALGVAYGGTGLTTAPANGALDIGNGTGFTRTTLTAGSGITITNTAGSITIAATFSGSSTVAGSNTQIQFNNSGVFGASDNLTWDGSKVTASAYQTGGNLTFTGIGNRITGDMTNATIANRLAFQTSTVNGVTNFHIIPNGTSTSSGLKIEGDSSIANGSRFTFDLVGGVDCRINSSQIGTGIYLPMTLYTGGSERVRVDIGGKLLVGTSSVLGAAADAVQILQASNSGIAIGTSTAPTSGTSIAGINAYGNDGSTYAVGGTINFRAAENWSTTNHGTVIQFRVTASGSGGALAEAMRIDSSSNVGIGTNAPVSKLQVTNSLAITAANGYQFLLMGNQDSSGTNKPTIIRSANAGLQFGIGDSWSSSTGGTFTPYLNIGSTGNVGIGTNAPAAKLHVAGDITGVGDLTLYRSGAPTTGYIYWGNTGTKYMGFDGSNIVASVSPAFSITGNAATATTTTNWGTYGAVPAAGSNASTANTIPRSDANGYSYFGYINSNTANSEAVTVSQVIVTNGSDNFYRKVSIANLTGFVQSNASGTWGINISGNAATVTGGITTSNYTTYAVKRTGNIGNGDLNSATYYNGSQVLGYNTATNRPGGEYGTMISINERTDTCLQMVVDYSTGFLYTRGIYTGGPTFSAWQTQLSSGNYNSYAPTLTGGGASGTWGISITGNAANVTGTVAVANGGTGQTTGYKLFDATFTSSIDANVNRTAGMYGSYASAATNTPTNSGILYNFMSGTGGAGDGGQFWQDYASDNLYLRKRWGGGFGGWFTMLSAGNYNSYAPTLTGGGASGTWGINISGNAANITAYTVNQSVGTGNAPTFYGVYSNNWFRSNNATGWYNETYAVGIWATEASNVRTYNNANFIAGGNVTAYSDERVKTNWRNLAPDFIKNLSELKSGIYDRTDTELTQVGVGAQSLQKFLPEAILVHGEGELSVAYGNAAMVSAVELAKRIVEQEARIARLEALVSKLIKE